MLLGSGETLPSSGKTHEYAAQRLPEKPRIVILETPAGFEPNSAIVAEKIKIFLERRLQNYKPVIEVVAARKKGTLFSPDNPEVVAPILKADEILLGPGSPSYGAWQLQDSLALQMITARQRRGGMLFLSSSATLAFGAFTLPVYEIYKVGEDLHWKRGLDYFKPYGLNLSIVSHWNNNDGGADLDTSRCYMGHERFERLLEMLPAGQTILGIDEHTSLIFDFVEGCCHVQGNDTITILRPDETNVFKTGESFPLDVFGKWRVPDASEGINPEVWEQAIKADEERAAEDESVLQPPEELHRLLQARDAARAKQDWATADALRDQIFNLGWLVQDTANGSELSPRVDS
jgi:hypothetical protein